jgi:hypothetical protein
VDRESMALNFFKDVIWDFADVGFSSPTNWRPLPCLLRLVPLPISLTALL